MGPEIAIARAAIMVDGKFLMARRGLHESYYGGELELVGGKLEPGEDPAAAMLREAWEEINGSLYLEPNRCVFRLPAVGKKYLGRTFVINGFLGRITNWKEVKAASEVAEIGLYDIPTLRKLNITPESRRVIQGLGYLV